MDLENGTHMHGGSAKEPAASCAATDGVACALVAADGDGASRTPGETPADNGGALCVERKSRFHVSRQTWSLIGLCVAMGVAVLRLAYCALTPIETIDVARNILYGQQVLRTGLEAADLSLSDMGVVLVGASRPLTFSALPFPYPIVPLLFFTAVSAVWPSFFFAKLCLTVMELANALMAARWSRDRFVGLLYWANPMSVWYVSREGQFEPLQNLWVFAALLVMKGHPDRRRTAAVCMLLMVGVQVKLSPVLLLPLVFGWCRDRGGGHWLTAATATAVALVPSIIGAAHYDWTRGALSTVFTVNFHYWNPWNPSMFHALGIQTRLLYVGLGWGMIVALVVWGIRARSRLPFLAPLGLLLLFKVQPLVQPWYFVVLPSFLLPIEDRWARRMLFAAACVIDPRGLLRVVLGPTDWTNQGVFDNLSVFQDLIGTVVF
jgi:hypothetical protein